MAVFKDCHQRLPKVLLKWWLSLKIVIKDCPKFCWSDGCLERLSSKTAQSSAEVMAVFKDCHQRLPKVLLKWWLSSKTREKTANLRLEKKIANQNRLKSVKIYSFSVWGAGIAPVDLTTLSSLRACRTFKTEVKRKFFTYRSDPFVTSDVSDAQNWGKTQICDVADRPFRHFGRVGRSKLW